MYSSIAILPCVRINDDNEDQLGLCSLLKSSGGFKGGGRLTKIFIPICLYCLNFTKFGQLILRKIIKIAATRCQILRLKCTKFDFGCGSAQTPLGELTALPSWI